jgi:zinc transport system substrate-binding protein
VRLTMKKLSLSLAFLLLAGCASTAPAPREELSIATTFYPLSFITKRIVGPYANVTQILPPGIEPHDFEPSPQDIAFLQNADLVILLGAGLDTWAEDRGEKTMIATADLQMAQDPEHGLDPHVWLDPLLFSQIAENIRDVLIEADPEHAEDYRRETEALSQDLAELHQEFIAGLSQCLLEQIIVSHDAYGYLARRYGFELLPISGISPEEEPSAKTLVDIATLAREKQIKHVFFESLVSSRLADTLAEEVDAAVLQLNPLEGLTQEEMAQGQEYLSIMRLNLQNLRTAMQCP